MSILKRVDGSVIAESDTMSLSELVIKCKADLWEADLRWADLRGADLRRADLRGADLDFSCLSLSCTGLTWKIDRRLWVQIAYHLCSMDVDDKECQEARRALLPLANKMHRIDVPGLE